MDLELFEVLEYVERETRGEALEDSLEDSLELIKGCTEIEQWIGEE